ncbi:MAG: EamA family transporter [Thermoplasmatales archaeon]|nr:EamA family transporter [Thermoplasmatales archaeon]
MNNKLLVSFVLVLVSLVWAGSFIVVQIVTEEIDPVSLGFLRFLIATPIMFLILLTRGKGISIPRKELPSLSILGLTGVTLLYLFQFIGIDITNASTAAVLINTNVIFIAILSALFLKETFGRKKISGVSLSFLGVIVIIFFNAPKETFLLENIFLLGCILILLSAFCWAIYSIVGKRLLKTYDMFTVTAYAFALGSLFYLPFVISDIVTTLQTVTIGAWLAVLYLALVCTVFGYIGWYYALKKTEASKAAVFLNLIPLFTIIMSFFIGESITVFFLLGAILIIYGVYLTQKS